MKTLARFAVGLAIAASSIVAAPPVAGAHVTGPTTATTRPHDCDDLVQASRRRDHHPHDHDDCGPPPIVPEVPMIALLPLTGAGVAAVAFGVGRRRGRTIAHGMPAS